MTLPTFAAPLEPILVRGITGTVARPAAAATRPPLLCVHGMLGGAWYFDRYQSFFAARGYPAYAVNLRGHHDSRPVPDLGRVSVLDYTDDVSEVVAWLTAVHGTPPILLGHSMGGLVVQKAAESSTVAALVLLCAAPPRGILVTSASLVRKQLKYLVPMLRSRPLVGTRGDSDDLTLNRVGDEARPALHARFVPESGRAGREISFGAIAVDPARVRAPVLSVSAAEDRFVAPRIGRRLAARYGGDFLLVQEHAHFLVYEPGWEGPADAIERWLAARLG